MKRIRLCCLLLLLSISYTTSFFLAVRSSRPPAELLPWSKRKGRIPASKRRPTCSVLYTMTVSEEGQEELDQDKAPIIEALTIATKNIKAAFFFPGHKMGRCLPRGPSGPFSLEERKGHHGGKRDETWKYDLPEIPELDNLFAPEGSIKEAEELAADLFGAKKTWFLVNGSTCGVIAALIACVRRHYQEQQQQLQASLRSLPPQGRPKVLLPRNAHKSAINGLILSGAEPIFLSPLYDAELDICHGIALEGPDGLRGALDEHTTKEGPGGVAAVLLISPTYHGVSMDIKTAAAICREKGAILIVDEAHGAHLQFMPASSSRSKSPTTGLAAGADLVIQSTHKTLTAVSQAAMAHAGPEVDETLIELMGSALQLMQSSSPNYVFLASLDGARWQLGSSKGDGRTALEKAWKLATRAKQAIKEKTRFKLLEEPPSSSSEWQGAFVSLDPLRLAVYLGPGVSGFEVDEILIEEHGVYAELPASRTMTFAIGPGSTEEDIDHLVNALVSISESLAAAEKEEEAQDYGDGAEKKVEEKLELPPFDGVQAAQRKRLCTPREAYFTPSEVLSTADDVIVGRASAETVCPYPPGIPILLPGEVITQDVLTYLHMVLRAGGSITGCSDATLSRLRVLRT